MHEQYGPIYYQNPSDINPPDNTTYFRVFINLLDNLAYVKKHDDTIELFSDFLGATSDQSVTYAELLAKIAGSTLKSGANYLITDFATRYTIPNTAVVVTGPVEPIIVTASSVNAIAPFAISSIFPQDELLYEVVDSSTAGGNKGRIYFRKETIQNVSAGYNWRVIQFRRWDDGLGNFTSITDNGNAFADFYTFNNSPVAFGVEETTLGPITGFGIGAFGAPTDYLNNTLLVGPCLANLIENDNFNNTLIAAIIAGNKIAPVFSGNTFLGGSIVLNRINVVCSGNTAGTDFANNVVGQQFSNNTIGDSFSGNDVKQNFNSNTIGNNFSSNNIETDFSTNIITFNFTNNTVGSFVNGNNIGNNFQTNQIQDGFSGNIILNNFNNNIIASNFIANININNDFRFNTIAQGLAAIDFALATFVYTDYSKTIFKNSASLYRLSYIDAVDTVQYNNVNA